MLKRIHIKGFRSLADVEVHLQPLSVLFGLNASGKSNLLRALRILSATLSIDNLTHAFGYVSRGEAAKLFTIGPDGLAGLERKRRLRFSIEADIHLSDAVVRDVNQRLTELFRRRDEKHEDIPQVRERDLRYRIEIEALPQSGTARVADEYLAVLNADGQPADDYQPFIERQGDKIHLRPEYEEAPTQHGPDLARTLLSRPRHPWIFPHAVAVRREIEDWLSFHFEPKMCMRQTYHIGSIGRGEPLRHLGNELASHLNRLKTAKPDQFKRIGEVLHQLIPNIDGVEVLINSLEEFELGLKENGEILPADLISDGTFHLLGLLALPGSEYTPSLISLEEPESSIYPGNIPAIAELLQAQTSLGRTQYIVTTHSPILPDYVPEECLFAVRRVDGQTRIDPIAPKEPERNGSAVGGAGSEDHAGMRVSERILRGDFDA